MTPTNHPKSLTTGDLANDLAELREWLEALRSVLGAVRPHSLLITPPPGWVPGGPDPTPPRALPICLRPVPANQYQVSVEDISDFTDTLANWTASIGDSLSRLPHNTPIPPGPGIPSS